MNLEKVVEPGAGESQDEFIARCMSAEKDGFPDREQRLAVCFSKWRGKATKAKAAAQVAPLVKELTKVVVRLQAIVVKEAREGGA